MSCANYLKRLLKSHGWDTESSKPVPSDVKPVVASEKSPNSIDAADDAADHSITHSVHDFNDASCEINNFLTARTNSRDFANSDGNLCDASDLVSTARTPRDFTNNLCDTSDLVSTARMQSDVCAIYESLGDSLSPPVIFDSKSTLTTLIDSDTKINTNDNTLFDNDVHHKMEHQASMK